MPIISLLLSFLTTALLALPEESVVPGGIKLFPIESKQAPVIHAFDHQVPVIQANEGQWLAIIGIPLDYDQKSASLKWQTPTRSTQTTFAISPKAYPTQNITLKTNKHVSLSQKNLDRYHREKKEITGMLDTFRDTIAHAEFTPPLKGRISGVFGSRRVYNGQPRKPHTGLDIAASQGSAIIAPAPGKIIGIGDYFFNGKTVFVEHGQGIITMYCHMDSITVAEGQMIAQGETIGKVGKTGRATGPHLHWGVQINGAWIDPLLLVQRTAIEG